MHNEKKGGSPDQAAPNDFDSHHSTTTDRREVSYAEFIASIGSDSPGVFITEHRHDDWCQTLKTGSGLDCNCEPDVLIFRVDDREDL